MENTQPLNLIYGMNKIFKQKAEPVDQITDEIREVANSMAKTMYFEQAVGVGANMVGVLKRIIVVDIREDNENNLFIMINPEITDFSKEKQVFEEASLCFPGIAANVERPKEIHVKYQDLEGKNHELDASGFLSSVIQHEVDYLDGKIFLDHLSKIKRDTLIRKMEKHQRLHPPHVHGKNCRH
jgi:peptide deformylase